MPHGRLYTVVCALAVFTCLASSQSGDVLRYVIEENQPPDTVIGDVMADANLTLTFDADDTRRPRFGVLLGAGTGYVTMNATSGVFAVDGLYRPRGWSVSAPTATTASFPSTSW